MPKDWDTIALFYNKEMTDAAGLTEAQLADLEWNPTDGGTYEQAIAKLTVDANGVHGDQPGFDKSNVDVRPRVERLRRCDGQTQWSMYTGSDRLDVHQQEPWGDQYNYNDPKFQENHWWYRADREGIHAAAGDDRRCHGYRPVRRR